jgi:hypothetical protein
MLSLKMTRFVPLTNTTQDLVLVCFEKEWHNVCTFVSFGHIMEIIYYVTEIFSDS